MNLNISVRIGKINLKNPVMNASGTLIYNEKLKDIINYNNLGAYVTKTIQAQPAEGFKPPRIVETRGGIINAVGGQTIGIDNFIKYEYPNLTKLDIPIIVSIAAPKINLWKELIKKINNLEKVEAVELNLSCSHTYRDWGSLAIGTSSELTFKVINSIRELTDLTLIAKLTPNVSDIQPIAMAAEKAGANAISLINTLVALAIDVDNQKPMIGNILGGLSGPCIKPVGLFHVWQVASVVNIPIIGMGGIMNYYDALEYIMAGATAVAVGTYSFRQPRCMENIVEDLKKYMISKRIVSIEKLIGSAKRS